MKHTWKRLLSLFMSLALLAGLMPAALAALPVAYEYIQDTDGVDSGAVYAIYTNAPTEANNRILYHTGTGKTDKVTGSVSGDELSLNGGFASSRQLWTITAVGNGYTVQSVDSGRYLDLSTSSTKNINTSSDPVALTIVFDEQTGLYTISQEGGVALSFDNSSAGNFLTADSPYGLRFYKQTEVEPTMAPGADSGTSIGQPFVKGDTDSQYFRIPALITLDNGWIVAASDIRWRTSGDSPQNLDTIVSLSKDGGATWNWDVVNYYDDMADNATGQASASFIDPSILQAQDGTVHMVVDACPSYVGLMYGNRMGWNSSGFDDEGRLLVTHGTAGGDASTAVADYTYYADINNAEAGVEKSVNGETITLYPICTAEDDSQSGAWVDAWLNVYVEEDGVITPDLCLQLSSSNAVQSNLFYRNSEWKAYPVFYIMHRSATVTETGLEWGDPQFLDIKLAENEAFTGVCPGRGLSFQYEGKERLVFPLYDNATGNELASVIYSDDGGKTWTRGQHNGDLNGVGKTSESQVVLLPDGTLRMYSRNTVNYISYADSTDGGVTWGTCQKDMDLYSQNPGNGCMVSFINLDGILVGPDNTLYNHLILASYPVVQRSQGVVRIGYVDESNTVQWLNDDETRYTGNGTYAYSCVTQLSELDVFGLLYEYAPDTNTIGYTTLTVTDLLGDGWHLVGSVDDLPSISLEQTVVDLKVGETATLTPTYTPVDGEVSWTSSNPDVATVDGGVITAVTSGTATITASVTSSGITRTASADVAIQGEDGVVLPNRYTDEVEDTYHEASTTYELDTDGMDSGAVYAIFHSGSNRILYHASGSTTSDHVTGSASDGLLKLDSTYAATRQTWIVTGDAETGYTVQSCEADERYLNLNAATSADSRVPVTDEEQVLIITSVDGSAGSYTVSRVVEDQTLYLAHENSTTQHYVSTEAVPFQFYRQVITEAGYTYATSVTGLEALIADLSGLKEEDYTSYSWAILQNALTAAQTVANAGSQSFDTEETALAAQAVIDQAAKDLYAAKLALEDTGSIIISTSYAITVDKTDNGTVTASRTRAPKGLTVTLTVKPDEGYALDTLTVTDKKGSEIKLTDKGNGKYTFTMPASAVTVKASFAKDDTPVETGLPFTDVKADDWFYGAVKYVYDNKLMDGTSTTTFAPLMTTNRAMVVTILWRLAGSPEPEAAPAFSDVAADSWYTDAVAWASENGIVKGYSDTVFAPDDTVTREQLATILYRYVQHTGGGFQGAWAFPLDYADADQVSDWAYEAMCWCTMKGIINGVGGNTLNPQGSATRAEVAQILMNFSAADLS
ncbi:S-layer homology domain-containing protein [uncultured Flavonifractor sp.]|uniref:S-layer homology domain-containing protein n=1 Tax=uncultured Flavonifractor sp. TaxID=1193534 RepID=UPI00266FCDBF|nr:S-layer homology domain-containing protein [uncultured Flavonifractor sp.]